MFALIFFVLLFLVTTYFVVAVQPCMEWISIKTKNKKKHKKAKAARYSGILKIYAFCQKIQQRDSDPGESAAGVT